MTSKKDNRLPIAILGTIVKVKGYEIGPIDILCIVMVGISVALLILAFISH